MATTLRPEQVIPNQLQGGVSESNQLRRKPFSSAIECLRVNKLFISLDSDMTELGMKITRRMRRQMLRDPIAIMFFGLV